MFKHKIDSEDSSLSIYMISETSEGTQSSDVSMTSDNDCTFDSFFKAESKLIKFKAEEQFKLKRGKIPTPSTKKLKSFG